MTDHATPIRKLRPALPAYCTGCPARDTDLLGTHPDGAPQALIDAVTVQRLAARERLYGCNDSADTVFRVRSGWLKLLRYSSAGEPRIVRLARPGDALGLEVLLHRPYRHCAEALVASEVCRLPAPAVRAQMARSETMRERVLTLLQAEVDSADDFLVELSTGHAPARLARLLLYLAGDASASCRLPGREDMGALLGLTTETVSRIVAQWRRDGVIAAGAGRAPVRIDRAALAELATH